MVDAHLDDGGWEWHYSDVSDATKAILTKVVRVGTASTEVSIPGQLVTGIPLLAVAANCFKDVEGAKITKVLSMPSTITSIGSDAFLGCVLMTSISIGDGVTSIGVSAFEGCDSLVSVTIPDSVTSLGDSAFWTCPALTTVILGSGITSIGEYAFAFCDALTSITIPEGVTTIEDDAFEACSTLPSLILPSTITTIGDYAFEVCSALVSITFLGFVAPIIVGTGWIDSTPATIRGHAYYESDFPAPGVAWNGLTMGTLVGVAVTYCSTTELTALTGTALSIGDQTYIIAQAEREINGYLYEAGLTPPGSDDILKAAALRLSAAGVMTRNRMDGTQPSSLNLGGLSLSDNIDAAIEELRNGARSLIEAYIRKATAALRLSSRIYKVNG